MRLGCPAFAVKAAARIVHRILFSLGVLKKVVEIYHSPFKWGGTLAGILTHLK
jgi:hypothetical protein